jgi:hypothetical protein
LARPVRDRGVGRQCLESQFHQGFWANIDYSYALFKAADKKLLDSDNVSERLSTLDKIIKE